MNKKDLFATNDAFAARLVDSLDELKILKTCEGLYMDHVCVRLNDSEEVEKLKSELMMDGVLLSAAVVNGRPIYIIHQSQPIQIGPWTTQCIELPHPKPGKVYTPGWEHVEFVLPDTANTMAGVQDSFFNHFPHLQSMDFIDQYARKDSEPEAEGDQIPNPTVGLERSGVGMKFHAVSIAEVVA